MFDAWMQRVAIETMREKTKEARPVPKNRAEKGVNKVAQNTAYNSAIVPLKQHQ